MDTLSIFKFWKTNKTKVAVDGDADGDRDTVADSTFSDPLTEYSDDDDDSFFELELTLPKFNSKPSTFSRNDLNSEKNEPKITSKPQSPISILRTASPKLRIFMFGKLIKKSKNDDTLFCDNHSVNSSCFSPKSENHSPFTVKFKIEDGSIVPKFTSKKSPPKVERRSFESSIEDSKRFSKDVVQKYLNFVKPLLNSKKSSSDNGGERFTVSCSPRRTSSSSSSASFPSPMKLKQLGKSKSASAIVVSATPLRNDHPSDGIEGAILHCKRSLDSTTRGYSLLSRCSSDPSHEESMKVSEEKH